MQVEILLSIQNDYAVKTVQNDTRQDKRAQKGKRRQHHSRNDSAHTLPPPRASDNPHGSSIKPELTKRGTMQAAMNGKNNA